MLFVGGGMTKEKAVKGASFFSEVLDLEYKVGGSNTEPEVSSWQ